MKYIIILLFLLFPSIACAQPDLIVNYNHEHWDVTAEWKNAPPDSEATWRIQSGYSKIIGIDALSFCIMCEDTDVIVESTLNGIVKTVTLKCTETNPEPPNPPIPTPIPTPEPTEVPAMPLPFVFLYILILLYLFRKLANSIRK